MGLPLPLALGLLKDTSGTIDIDLPISGDLDDPSFSAGGVIVTAFINLITKAVTAPFSILGSLVEGGDKLSSAAFKPGLSELDDGELEKLGKLAEALKKRPALQLEVRGQADSELDLKALKQQQVMSSIDQSTVSEAITQLEKKMQAQSKNGQLLSIQQNFPTIATASASESDLQNYLDALLSALASDIEIEAVTLITLAKARSTYLTEQLVNGQSVPAESVFTLEPEVSKQGSESNRVLSEFNLTVQ